MTDLAARVRAGDRDRWVTAMMAGPLAPRLMALYAFDLEVARIPAVVSEPLLGEMRLQFWRDVVEAIHAGRPVPGHEVAGPLAEAVADLPRAPLDALLDARRFDLAGEPHPDRASFDRYIAGAHAGLMALAARALGGGEGTDALAADVGHAAGVARTLRAAPALVARGINPLPVSLGPEGLADPGVRAEVNAIAEDALARLARARSRRRDAPAATAPAFFAAWRAEDVLRRAAQPGFDPAADLAGPSEFRARAALALRAMLGRW